MNGFVLVLRDALEKYMDLDLQLHTLVSSGLKAAGQMQVSAMYPIWQQGRENSTSAQCLRD